MGSSRRFCELPPQGARVVGPSPMEQLLDTHAWPSPSLNSGRPIICPLLCSCFPFSLPCVLSCPVSSSAASFSWYLTNPPNSFSLYWPKMQCSHGYVLHLLKISYAWVIELTADMGENTEKHIIMIVMMIAMVLLSTGSLPGSVQGISCVFIHFILHEIGDRYCYYLHFAGKETEAREVK